MARLQGKIGSSPKDFNEAADWEGVEQVFWNTDRTDRAGNIEVWIDDEKWVIAEPDLDRFRAWVKRTHPSVDVQFLDYRPK